MAGFGLLARGMARANTMQRGIEQEQEQAERQRVADERAREMAEIQQAALLAGLQEQGITRGGSGEPIGSTGYTQDPTMTKRAKELAAQRQRQEMLNRRRAVLQARGVDPNSVDVESDDVYESFAKRPTESDPNWQTVEGKDGFYQVNPKTGQTRRVEGVQPKPAASNGYRDMSAASTLRGQYNSEQTVKDASAIAGAYQRIRAVANDPSAAGDLSLIFSYMKMLDPGSTVREGEFANAQNAAGIPDQVRNLYNRAKSGERLNPAQRADFLKQAENLVGGQRQALSGTRRRYEEIATRNKMNPQDIVHDPFETDVPAAPAQSASRAQQLWDAAVKKHGEAKVLAEFGPRPSQ